MSYLDHTNLRQFVSNFKKYIISRINGKAEAVHTHGNITNDGRIGTDYDVPLSTDYGGYVGPGEWLSGESIDDMFEDQYYDVIQIDASDMEPNTQIYVYAVNSETPMSMPGNPLLMIENSVGLFYRTYTDGDKYIFTVGNKQTGTIDYYNKYDDEDNLIPGIYNAGGHLIKIFENSNTYTVVE